MSNEEKFIARSKKFRLHFQLSEDEIDLLLLGKNLIYKGIESNRRKLNVELIEAYTLIFGLNFAQFSEDIITYPLWDDLPEATKKLLQDRPFTAADDVGEDGLIHQESYIILALKHLDVGSKFTESDLIRCLPSPLNKGLKINWYTGMLKGAFKKLRKIKMSKNTEGEEIREALHLVHKPIEDPLIGKAKKKLGVQ